MAHHDETSPPPPQYKYIRLVHDLATDMRRRKTTTATMGSDERDRLVGDEALSLARTMSALAHDSGVDCGDFVVTRDAYTDFLGGAAGGQILRLVRQLTSLETRAEEEEEEEEAEIGERIRSGIMQTELPTELRRELQSALRGLRQLRGPMTTAAAATAATSSSRIKVNSSASERDLPPGETILHVGVATLDDVLCAIKRCYASLFSSDSIHYRRQNQLPHDKCSIALIVQKEEIPH